jgi:hypothetical protein
MSNDYFFLPFATLATVTAQSCSTSSNFKRLGSLLANFLLMRVGAGDYRQLVNDRFNGLFTSQTLIKRFFLGHGVLQQGC